MVEITVKLSQEITDLICDKTLASKEDLARLVQLMLNDKVDRKRQELYG